MEKVIVLTGPTGIGKTALSIEIAKHLNTDIINGDAFQIYKGIEIATASPTLEEKKQVNHILFNFLDATSEFSISDYQKLVRGQIAKKVNEKKVPFIVGGSGLYINSVVYDYQFSENKRSAELKDKYINLSNEELHDILKEVDFEASQKIHPNNRKRVERAIELVNDKDTVNMQNEKVPFYDTLILFLDMPRDILYERINNRVDGMVNEGLLEEFERMYPNNLGPQSQRAIGVQELIEYKKGNISLDDAIDLIKQHSRNYAKRQITWFKHKAVCHVIDKENTSINEVLKIVDEFLTK